MNEGDREMTNHENFRWVRIFEDILCAVRAEERAKVEGELAFAARSRRQKHVEEFDSTSDGLSNVKHGYAADEFEAFAKAIEGGDFRGRVSE